VNVLLVSSFVLPHAGGVEQFVETAREELCRRGWNVRVLSCRLVTTPIAANATVPTVFLPPGGWPLPVGGWRTIVREVKRADVVVANGARNLLPIAATFAAHLSRRPALFILHGSGAPFTTGSFLYHRLLGSAFEWMLARPALRLSQPLSVSRAGVGGAKQRYSVKATYLPYPLRDLPPANGDVRLRRDEPVRIVWAGRLYPEKDPVTAVQAVERVRRAREATLDVYGDGVLKPVLDRLSATRTWLSVHGERSWEDIQLVQARAHLSLSTSARDNVQVGLLEPLSRGIPAVSTQVGDAREYYADPALARFCVAARDSAAIAASIIELTASYGHYRSAFAANAGVLRTRHGRGIERLATLIDAAREAAAPTRLSPR
jgi:glycosyltransferase involved in cell wall biosynthesis